MNAGIALIRRLGWLLAVVAGSAAWAAEPADPARLDLDRLYVANEFDAKSFNGRWLDGEPVYTTVEDDPAGGKRIVRHDPANGESRTLVSAAEITPPGASKALAIDDYAFSRDRSLVLVYTNSQRVWRRNTRGDYWLLDRSAGQLRELGGGAPAASLMFAKIAPDGRHVAYVRDGNVFVEDIRGSFVRQLTTKTSADTINGTFDWVYEEELGLADGFRWSPDGRRIAYWQLDTEGVGRIPLVNNTDSFYPQVQWIPYPKTGERNSSARVGVVAVEGGETGWIAVVGDPREQYIARMDWADNSDELVLEVLNRLQNENRVLLANPRTGETRPMLVERDDAWVDVHDERMWLDDGKAFTWLSERDGWRHLYLASRKSGEPRQVTRGAFDVVELLHASSGSEWLYFLASPDDPTRRYLYRVRKDGSNLARVTPKDAAGSHAYAVSSDGRWAIHTASSIDDPPRVELVALPEHRAVKTFEDNAELRAKLAALEREPTEFYRLKIADGPPLDGWLIRPPGMEAGKTYPLIVFVYGEPAGQTVADVWSPRHHWWHVMLAQRGYAVASFDNRGARVPRGREWRKSVYRQVGSLGPADQAAALGAFLAERPEFDPERVGVWGWSGGGSSTLHALFKYPDLYRVGVSVAPVANQRYYDTIYQERYMGLPSDNAEGYRAGSPIAFADGLRGDLLLIHGTADDNVHYQITEILVNELIRLDKPFTLMPYPNRTHAIREGPNTTRHLRGLMTRFFEEKLPAGPR